MDRKYSYNDKEKVYLVNEETDEEIEIFYTLIAEAFVQYWWSFVRCIGQALRHADPFNVAKILSTRPNYVQQYCNEFIIPELNEKEQEEPRDPNQGTEEN